MIKQKIVICSLQKPVDEPRMLHRLAFSLGQTNEYDIKIIGFPSKNINFLENISYCPLIDDISSPHSRRKLLFQSFKQLKRDPPSLLIICTHELLEIGLWMKWRYGTKVVFDIQENYPLNLIYMSGLKSPFLKKCLSTFIKLRQRWYARWISLFILAEKCYEQQLDFIQDRYIIFENKVQPELTNKFTSIKSIDKKEDFLISITGTISSLYGLHEIIHFTNYFSICKQLKFNVLGHSPISEDELLLNQLDQLPNVTVKTSKNPIPYTEILDQIAQSDAILSIQKPNPAIQDKIPSKIYEAAAFKKVIIVRNDLTWSDFVQNKDLGLVFDYQQFNKKDFIQRLMGFRLRNTSINQYTITPADKLTLSKAIKDVIDIK